MAELESEPVARLKLFASQLELMRADVDSKLPQEACGLLAGRGNEVKEVFPVSNEFHSPVRYRMDPVEQLKAFQLMDERSLEIVGIYHSHPSGPDRPSQTDIAEAYYPQAATLIWYQLKQVWYCKGFMIRDGFVSTVALQLIDG